MTKKIYFTLDEANQMIPFLRTQIDELRDLKKQIQDLVIELEDEGIDLEKFSNKENLNDHEKTQAVELETMADQINAIVLELSSLGILLKDIEKGLVDFYCRMGEDDVFLCWKYGEKEIEFFHNIQDGFLGRKSLYVKDVLKNVTQLH